MARVAAEPAGFWKVLAVSSVGLIIMMLGWFLVYQVGKTDALEDAVGGIKTDIAVIKQSLGIADGR